MKKLFLLASAAFLFSGVSFAQDSKKKCDKASKCCKKSAKKCCKDKDKEKTKTAKM